MPCGARLEVGWIPVRRTVARDGEVAADDHIDIAIKLLPILEQPAQDDIVRDELERRGWRRQPDGSLTKPFGEANATLAPGTTTIRVAVAQRQSVRATASSDGVARAEDVAAQDAIGARAGAAADAELARVKQHAVAELVQRNIASIQRVESAVRAEVAGVANAATKRSLLQRAAEIGAIESSRESRAADGSLELTITVKT